MSASDDLGRGVQSLWAGHPGTASSTQRIRLLPANTLLHIPSSCRLRMTAATPQCWQGMARGSEDFAPLEEGCPELLLASVPQGLGTATEVAKRLTLWEECRFEDLLRRDEEQLLIHRKAGKRKMRDALIPQREPTVLAEQPLLARTARRPRGLSRRCFPLRRRKTLLEPKSFSPPPP